jgi:hypothetical protein
MREIPKKELYQFSMRNAGGKPEAEPMIEIIRD